MNDTPLINQWDRREGETPKAFAAFTTYLHIGPGRSLAITAQKLGLKTKKTIEPWCARYKWVKRAEAFDNHLAEKSRQHVEQQLQADSSVWASRIQQQRQEQFVLGELAIERAKTILNFPLVETKTKDGKTIVKPAKWTLADASRLIEVGSKLKQLALGMPTDRSEHTGKDGTPLPVASAPAVVIYLPDNGRDGKKE